MMLSKALQSAAGNAGGEPLYSDSVFSCYLYTGNGSTQTITNNIDLAGEGGMVWIKNRGAANSHRIFDTVRGSSNPSNFLDSASTNAQNTGSTDLITSFNSTGFDLGNGGVTVNSSSNTYASWTFRKAQKWFDVVTYSGNDVVGRTVPHSLGSAPGVMIIKSYNQNGSWWIVYHRSLGAANYLQLSATAASAASSNTFNNTGPTDTVFTLGASTHTNASGYNYVAYLFAHDAGGFGADGSENVISCGSYTGNGSTTGPTITLGWEPQYILIKYASRPAGGGAGNWRIVDVMRGFTVGSNDSTLNANDSTAEVSATYISPNATGFSLNTTAGDFNQLDATYIYIAIRRPMKPPTVGTEVFAPVLVSEATFSPFLNTFSSGFVTDWTLEKYRDGAAGTNVFSRLTGTGRTYTNATNAETSATGVVWDSMTGATIAASSGSAGSTVIEAFKRASGFFDVVCYTGTGSVRTVNHNLTVAPELMICKSRSGAAHWPVYAQGAGVTKNGYLSLTSAFAVTGANPFNGTAPTSSVFTVGSDSEINGSGSTYVAYLFATLPGISKVGSYTGTGSTIQVNCGFTSGVRFLMIKRTDSTGGWYVWDSARGIVPTSEPYLLLNSTAAEVYTDYIDPYSPGFQVSSLAPAELNANGGTYVFLAIS